MSETFQQQSAHTQKAVAVMTNKPIKSTNKPSILTRANGFVNIKTMIEWCDGSGAGRLHFQSVEPYRGCISANILSNIVEKYTYSR